MALNFISRISRNRTGGELKTRLNNIKAQGGITGFLIMLMLATIVALSVAWPVIDSAIYSGGSAAHGTLTLAENVSCGQYVNITLANGTKMAYNANFTTPEAGCTIPLDTASGVYPWPLNPSSGSQGNNSTNAATSLQVALQDDNADGGTMSFTNPSAGVVYGLYATTGTPGNSVVTVENINGSWAAGTFTGGAYGATQNMSASSLVLVGLIPLFLVLTLLMLFIRPLL